MHRICFSDVRSQRAFSLIELLLVMSIIALLIAILLPVLGNVRKVARSTACLANLQQWGVAFQSYLSSNHGRPPVEADDYLPSHRWWEWLRPHAGSSQAAMTCPEARALRADAPSTGSRGSATCAWSQLESGQLLIGSYGLNGWIFQPERAKSDLPFIQFPPTDAVHIPVMGDCTFSYTLVSDTEPMRDSLIDPQGKGIDAYCIDRHRRAVNITFLDGHAEHVALADLWKLKWSQFWSPRNVVLPE